MKTPHRLRRETWLSIRQAASRIGRELLGSDWSDTMLDRELSTALAADIRHDLYRALSSGEVKALTGDGSHYFDSRYATWPGFRIDIQKNMIEIGELQTRSYCQLNAKDLDDFLSKYRETRFSANTERERNDQCFAWLCSVMAKPKTQSKRAYEKDAIKKFGIGSRPFAAIWAQAIKDTGNSSWSQPGRPKSKR